MLIPLKTDAPVYHFPWATIGIIAVNTAIQAWMTATAYEHADPLCINYGSFAPQQWLTSAFLHAGWIHLIGNMIFLWIFGLVVEGKVGWWRFLCVYAAIALLSGMIEQVIMLGAEGGSLGASGVIFGLLAIALVWAPENEIDSLLILYGVHRVEWSIKVFAGIFLALQVLDAALMHMRMSTPILHLLGALCGLPMGILMLKKGWVDCEGWDWFSRTARHHAKPRSAAAPATSVTAPSVSASTQAELDAEYRSSFIQLVEVGNWEAALKAWSAHGGPRWQAPAPIRERLVGMLAKANRIAEARPILEGILAHDPGNPSMGLLLAQILIRERRPSAARHVLDAVRSRLSPGRQAELAATLREQCAKLTADGAVEFA